LLRTLVYPKRHLKEKAHYNTWRKYSRPPFYPPLPLYHLVTIMHIPRLYIPQRLTENSHIELEPAAAHHIAKVLRMKAGRSVTLFNGQAHGEYSATLKEVGKKHVSVHVGQFSEKSVESPLSIELGACLIKNDRMDWLLQKATELGVTSITPLWSQYTDSKLSAERIEKKRQHWQQVLISASEQSGRVTVPQIARPQKIHQWLTSIHVDYPWVLHPYDPSLDEKNADKPIATSLKNFLSNSSDHPTITNQTSISAALLVGPEGGLTSSEVALALKHGFYCGSLGPRILRAETAPLVAISLLQAQLGDIDA